MTRRLTAKSPKRARATSSLPMSWAAGFHGRPTKEAIMRAVSRTSPAKTAIRAFTGPPP